jgi:hypothetical protein
MTVITQVLVAILAVLSTTVVQAEELTIEGKRPVAQVVRALRVRHQWRISFEDDMIDGNTVSEPVRFSYDPGAGPSSVLDKFFRERSESFRQHWKVLVDGDAFVVVSGSGSPLSNKFHFRSAKVSFVPALRSFCSALTESEKARSSLAQVVLGRLSPPALNKLGSLPAIETEKGETARSLLSRWLEKSGAPPYDLFWVDELQGYVLTFGSTYSWGDTRSIYFF